MPRLVQGVVLEIGLIPTMIRHCTNMRIHVPEKTVATMGGSGFLNRQAGPARSSRTGLSFIYPCFSFTPPRTFKLAALCKQLLS